ncbi:sorting nexin-1 isoform X2 [Petaurus breviceps papuanus]|uniref:sorting nexin-1 isoform X2 n=1 Tax=Petaurus breviceps papuanus TaxID=3040969 RepID=UPI0036D958F7
MASGGGGGGCSASERLPPPFPIPEPPGPEGAAGGGGSELEAGDSDAEGEDIFTGAASKSTSLKRASPSLITSNSQENGVHEELDQEQQDLFADATVELSLDNTHNHQKDELAKGVPSFAPQEVTNSSCKSQPKNYEELEEEEQEDQFDLTICITDPEKIGDGMNAYVAYKVTTQTSLPMFRSQQFSVKRRFSDFLGLYEKLSEKHSQNGFIVPPPPEKSLIGMTKVKVGKEDSSSAEFLEKRRAALERYLQRIVNHPTMLQDPDVREFLEKEELPRAVGTQTLSGAGLLKMFNKATDAVSKMTIKMNESDIGAFDHRMKTWQRWQDAQTMLQKKRETEARLLWANKPDKLQQAKDEIAEWESRVTQYERDFERISAVVRKEVIRFEKEKSKDFRNHVIKYLETLLYSQQQLVKYWEAFLPEAKAIS